mgnify:CR=1 FL=1
MRLLSVPLEVHRRTIEELVIHPLVLDVLFDDVFIDADGGDEVSSAPEALLLDGMALLGEEIVHTDGTLSFEEAHDVGNRILWWDFEKHVDVVGAGIGFEDLHFFLGSEEAEDFADLRSGVAIEHLLSVFGYNDDVILAIPDHMTLRFEGTHDGGRE